MWAAGYSDQLEDGVRLSRRVDLTGSEESSIMSSRTITTNANLSVRQCCDLAKRGDETLF